MKLGLEIVGFAKVRDQFRALTDREFKKGVATGLTRTAWKVRTHIQGELPRVFDRPTPYTLRAIFVEEAAANQPALFAEVRFMDDFERRTRSGKFFGISNKGTPATKYLNPNVEGGTRRWKAFEKALQYVKTMVGGKLVNAILPANWYVVPGPGATLDQYGNMSRGQVNQILSQLRISVLAGSNRAMSHDPKKAIAAQRKAGGRFFVVPVGGKGKPGIYQREFYGNNITPVVFFVQSVKYKRRFPFYDMASKKAAELLPNELAQSLTEQIERAFK
jgi:hypothetical protein